MKKFLLPLVIVCILAACNNADKKHNHSHGDEPKTQADSLEQYIDDGHIEGMSKMAKLHNTKKDVQRVIDSIAKLPAKAQQAAASYIEKLKSAIADIDYADFAMEKWMTEYDMDSAKDNAEQRLQYLLNEKLKVSKMKDAILNNIQKADSLLKAKL